ncbi:MAG: ClpXP protease specificity-enhancing factor SspB [Myxococcota bacterium]
MDDDDKPRLPPKKDVALALLQGTSLYVHLDPRRPSVLVPKHFLEQPQLVLQLGLNMAVRIPDLEVDDDGITCTLSFNRTPFWCRLPWSAVFALVGEDGRGMVWPNDVPRELAAQARRPSLKVVSSSSSSSKKKDKPRAAVDAERAGDAPPTEDAGATARAKPRLSAVPSVSIASTKIPSAGDPSAGASSPDASSRERDDENDASVEPADAEGEARDVVLATALRELPRGRGDDDPKSLPDGTEDDDDDDDDDGGDGPGDKKKLPPYLRVVK